MKTIQDWLSEYAVSHQNPTNKMVHFVCVPLIFFTVVGLFYSIPFRMELGSSGYHLNVAVVLMVAAVLYYFMLSKSLSVGMALFSLLCLYVCHLIYNSGIAPLWAVSLGIFVTAWVFQFWGHSVEGKKPSFLKDLQFLLIGPAWIMSFVYKKLGISI